VDDSGGGRQPNLLVIMADQHRADVMGCSGDPVVRTPNIDRLAAEGVRFSRTTCQGPLCMPARASYLTGRYVRDHGVYSNWAEVDPGLPTHPRALRDAGYHTAVIGKTHLYRPGDHGARHVDEMDHLLHAYGYAEIHGTGDKFDTNVSNIYFDHLRALGLLDPYVDHMRAHSYHGEDERGVGASKSLPTWDATPMPLPVDAYIDVWHGEQAVRWLEAYDRDEPFHLFVGFPGPHDPWDAPAEAVAGYDLDTIPLPRSTQRPDLTDTGRYGTLIEGLLALSDSATMDLDAIRAMRRAYYAAVTLIDDAVGRIVDALGRTGRLDDTWIVYTSDHGEMAGDHSLLSKCLFYTPTVRVPLVVRPPGGMTGRVVDDLVEHVDLAATLVELAGADPLPGSEGRSLAGCATGVDPPARPVAVSENWGFASFETDRYRLVVDEDRHQPVQLLDLEDDPAEDRNRVADPAAAATVDALMATFAEPFLATPPARPHPNPIP
jgi:choline-sulfatase